MTRPVSPIELGCSLPAPKGTPMRTGIRIGATQPNPPNSTRKVQSMTTLAFLLHRARRALTAPVPVQRVGEDVPTRAQMERLTGLVFQDPTTCEACGCRLPKDAVSYCNASCAISDGVAPAAWMLGFPTQERKMQK